MLSWDTKTGEVSVPANGTIVGTNTLPHTDGTYTAKVVQVDGVATAESVAPNNVGFPDPITADFPFQGVMSSGGTWTLHVWSPLPQINFRVDNGSYTLSISSQDTAICAGNIKTSPHQTTITARVLGTDGQPVVGRRVTFSLETFLKDSTTPLGSGDPDADLAASIYPLTATTDATGKATTVLTSGREVGSHAIVKAKATGETSQTLEAQSGAIAIEDAEGEMSIDADTLVADGTSTAGVYLMLNYRDMGVDNHDIGFHISRVWDANDNEVQPDANGLFSGYGSIVVELL